MTFPHQRTESRSEHARPSAPPYPEDPTTATRHLCAGAYLDDSFRNDALRLVYYQGLRVIAPSYGFDAVPVLAHCLRARNGAIIRDVAILGTVGVAFCAVAPALLVVLYGMAVLQATISTYRLVRDTVRRLRDGDLQLGALVPRVFLAAAGWALAFLLGTFVTASLLGQTSEAILTGGYDSGVSLAAGTAAASLLIGLLIFSYPVAFSLWRQAELSRMAPGSRVTQPVQSARLDDLARQQRGNTTVYSGYNQHVGAGAVLGSNGFAQRLVRAAPNSVHARHSERELEFERPPFDAQELVDHIRDHLSALLPQREAEEQIPGLTVTDRVCLAGTEVSHLAPYTSPEVMAAVVRHPTTPARHYLACQVFAWGGQLVTTVYVHVAVQGRSLYLEMTTTALPPCDDRFRIIDSVDGYGAAAWLRAFTTGLAETPRAIWRSPVNLAAALINLVAGTASTSGGASRVNQGFDYGARIGIRELGSEPGLRYRTQLNDIVKYKKLIERRVIASVLDFLDERDIDTAEYRARAASILNISGGVNSFGSGDVTNHGAVHGGGVPQGART